MLRPTLSLWCFRIVSFAWLSLTTARAVAQQVPVSGVRLAFVRTEGASGCLPTPALQREVVRRMGHDPFTGDARQWIEGTIERQSEYFEVQLFERDAEGRTLGSRRLREQSGDCHVLDDAIVLAIALIIDPTAQLAPASSVEIDPSLPARAASAAPSVPVAIAPVPAVREVAPRYNAGSSFGREPTGVARADVTQKKDVESLGAAFVAADALMVYGVFPGVAFGAELLTRVALDRDGRYSLKLSAVTIPEKLQNDGENELGYGLTAMQAGACVASHSPRAFGFGCMEVSLGAVHTVVHSPEPLKPDDRLWAALRLEVGAGVRIAGPVWLDLRLFDWVAPRLWEFRVVSNPGAAQVTKTAFVQKPLMPGLALGLGLHFD